jgi:tetratricopeptide (TPR) repeat protein
MALGARDASSRAKYATRGLSHAALERDTQQLLLRQLYLAQLERQNYAEARGIAEQMVSLGELEEPAHHDAARACMAADDLAAAVRHLRLAARRAPAHRRSVHLWSMGRALYLDGKYPEAIAAFTRALRWASDNQVLYRAHTALARHHRGEEVDLRANYEALGALQPLPLYAEFLGGELLLLLGEKRLARSLFEQFIRQVPETPLETAVGLLAEMRRAREFLSSALSSEPP